MTTVEGRSVDVRTADGTADAYLTHPADGGRHPGVLMYMDAFGPRPQLRSAADRLAAAGYTVLLPNVFYRHGRAPVVPLPAFLDADAERALFVHLGPILRGLTPDLAMRDAEAYLRTLADCPAAAPGPVGVTGYCMGARLSLRTAAAFPERVAAAAGFHGGRLATEAPDSPHLVAGRITAEVYFGHADADPSLPADQIARLEQALTDAGVRHRCEVYPGAPHGFTQADSHAYDADADARHRAALLDLLDRTLTSR
ncbi:dienelactone hydrolase family protein [Streptomyces sp. NPDC093094]|uniref:dienelactone hydrolase family protein n=1 Tax=Streptomyces sp. NPDC093094 TaxID=3366026 RepID=UPI003804FA40